MFELVNKLDSWLEENRYDFHKKLNKGLTDLEIKLWEEKFGFEFPDGFKILYQWRNGQRSVNREHFFSHLYFDSIEVVFETWEESNEDLLEFNEADNVVWGKSWLRFMSSIDSNGYCLDVKGDLDQVGDIIYFSHNSNNELYCRELETMLEMIVCQFEKGVYGYEKIGNIVSFSIIDPLKENEIYEYYRC